MSTSLAAAAAADDLYSRRKRIATYWRNKAADLHASAGALWYCMRDEHSDEVVSALKLGRGFSMYAASTEVYKMLCGMALELAFKAVIVSNGKSPPEIHNLTRLASLARVGRLTAREKGVLALLTEYIIWDGRYPVPKKPEFLDKQSDLASKTLFRAQRGKRFRFLTPVEPNPLDWTEFQKLWRKAWKKYVPSRE